MFSNTSIKMAKYGYIVMSVIFCVLGILLIALPDFSINLLCTIGGILLILFGCVKIIGYVSRDLYRLAFQFDLAFGILLIILGIILIFRSESMVRFLCVLIGICTLTDGLLKIQTSIDARNFGISKWWGILAAAVLTVIIGFLLIFRPYQSSRVVMVLLGVSFLAEAVLNVITVITAVKISKKNEPIEVDGEIID